MSPSVPLHQALAGMLTDPVFVAQHLNTCLAEEDPKVFLSALRDVARANHINISELSRRLRLNRRHLYRVLSEGGNPTLDTLQAVLDALGFQLSVSTKKAC